MHIVRFLMIGSIAAVAQFGVFVMVFSWSFGIADAGHNVPLLLQIILGILGTPLMHLTRLPPSMFEFGHGKWWGDDGNFIIGLAAGNAAVWGLVAASLIEWRNRRGKIVDPTDLADR
jgi:hypothetical protein